ncbi:hypothetical protein DL546_003819 [Coniochaeta pulveracea]|uniref:Uncharacterized protein n=1 Tax=Coniochaeta pulveracea TaxID=177199 RepID=A0A420YCB8_9PEZI|nr:hypothetical protein DL546_003819 [Coniochaeta pulveracea]
MDTTQAGSLKEAIVADQELLEASPVLVPRERPLNQRLRPPISSRSLSLCADVTDIVTLTWPRTLRSPWSRLTYKIALPSTPNRLYFQQMNANVQTQPIMARTAADSHLRHLFGQSKRHLPSSKVWLASYTGQPSTVQHYAALSLSIFQQPHQLHLPMSLPNSCSFPPLAFLTVTQA